MLDENHGLPGYYRHAPETSKLAAESVADAARSRTRLALAFIGECAARGATADEVADALEWERYSSRPRLAELHKRGVIVDSGGRRIGVSGRAQAVWVTPEFGPDAPTEPLGDLLDWLAAGHVGGGS